MADWADLPESLLIEIAERVGLYDDFKSIDGVCRKWRAARRQARYGGSLPQVPWLMLAEDDDHEGGPPSITCRFYCLSTGMVHRMELPLAVGNKRCYSSHGWLMTISRDLTMSLLNPFSGLQIQLPDKTSLSAYQGFMGNAGFTLFIEKFALSSSPSQPQNYWVMIVYGASATLACWRPGDDSWTKVGTQKFDAGGFSDISYYKGEFYAVAHTGQIVACAFDASKQVVNVRLVANLKREFVGLIDKIYLVESDGRLLVVKRGIREDNVDCKSTAFWVLELDVIRGGAREVKDLGSRSLFLGDNSSMSIEASRRYGCRANCVYYTDDCFADYWPRVITGGKDMGIFDLLDGSVEPLYAGGESLSKFTPPMWVEPRC
ncbi:hypothetical protein Ancab_018718 [Ancistrocladus abbreviatus]